MTAIERIARTSSSTPFSATRKDLLGVGRLSGMKSSHSNAVAMVATRQRLADLGYHVHRVGPQHWVLTLSTPLPELHFYSEAELKQFAANRARQYANAHIKEAS